MLSFPHLIVLFIVALMVFGPEKLPELARTLGKAMAEFKRMTGDVRRVMEDEMREIERHTEAVKREAAATLATQQQAQSAALPAADPGALSGTVPADRPTKIQPANAPVPDDQPTIHNPSIAKPGALDTESTATESSADAPHNGPTPDAESDQDFSHVKHNPS
jgi:sec-independent protein translocase protein TatB